MKEHFAGLDLSWSCSAIVVIDPGGAVVARTRIKTDAADFESSPKRLAYIRNEVLGFLSARREVVGLLGVENYAFGNPKNATRAGELGGIVRLALWEHGYSYVDVATTSLKKLVTGSGTAQKALILREVWRKYGFEAADDNEADAFGAAQFARLVCTGGTTKGEAALIKKASIVKGYLSS